MNEAHLRGMPAERGKAPSAETVDAAGRLIPGPLCFSPARVLRAARDDDWTEDEKRHLETCACCRRSAASARNSPPEPPEGTDEDGGIRGLRQRLRSLSHRGEALALAAEERVVAALRRAEAPDLAVVEKVRGFAEGFA